MDTDDEVAERRGRPATRRRHREDDEEDDDDEDSSRSNPARHTVGEDLSHRIVELRTPTTESDGARPSNSGQYILG